MDTQLALCTFEQSERLKKAGFDWATYNYFDSSGNHNDYDGRISAPTVELALQFMREVKKIENCVNFSSIYNGGSIGSDFKRYYFGKYATLSEMQKGIFNETVNFDTHPAAASALLDELLTLIEEEKSIKN